MRSRSLAASLLSLLLGLTTALGLPPISARALELRGQTFFKSPPWKLVFRNYYSNVFESGGEYYFTIEMPEQADAGLGALLIQQTAGVDWSFYFDVGRTRAFFGVPRREKAPVTVQASFDPQQRLFRITFPDPPPPGQTVTVALRPFYNPSTPGIYLFAVTAFPAGPEPVGNPVGVARMPIYTDREL
jgi:hypothetical protein